MMKRVHFEKTRKYLEQVQYYAQKVELLEERIKIREGAGLDTVMLQKELEAVRKDFLRRQAEVSDMISRIPRIDLQWILSKRYVKLMDWHDIACEGNMKYRTMTNKHGFALPEMQDVLIDAGIISPEEADDITKILPREETPDSKAFQDYLKYREEKKRGEV